MFLLIVPHLSNAKEIALTFDDSPRHARGFFYGHERAKKLIESLKNSDVEQVAFFSVSKQIDTEGRARLLTYADAGHIIANHTHSHPNINAIPVKEYIKDFKIADKVLKDYSNFKKWFRFPYLREGKTIESRDGMRAALKDLGYFNAYITINNYDWYIETMFQREVKRPGFSLSKMKDFYVSVMMVICPHSYSQVNVSFLAHNSSHN